MNRVTQEKTTQRISLWSGPRNVSTALMYSFAQRADTKVFDEPLYAHYLVRSKARHYHPSADEIIASMDQDGARVVREVLLGDHGRPVAFFKNMAHHLVDLDLGFLAELSNVILTRDPAEMLLSYARTIERPNLADTGYPAQVRLLDLLLDSGLSPIVLDSRELLLDPHGVLVVLCDRLGIGFDERMLSWTPGARPEDGVWAEHWYARLHESSGFKAYKPRSEPVPPDLEPLLEECLPLYAHLYEHAIRSA